MRCGVAVKPKTTVAPVRERGLKSEIARMLGVKVGGRSREGAWIEISTTMVSPTKRRVAPVRERGLKFVF